MTKSFMRNEQQIKEEFYGFLNTRNQQKWCQHLKLKSLVFTKVLFDFQLIFKLNFYYHRYFYIFFLFTDIFKSFFSSFPVLFCIAIGN